MHGHGVHFCIRLAGSALFGYRGHLARASERRDLLQLQQQKVFYVARVLRSARQALPRFHVPPACRYLASVSPFAERMPVAVMQG